MVILWVSYSPKIIALHRLTIFDLQLSQLLSGQGMELLVEVRLDSNQRLVDVQRSTAIHRLPFDDALQLAKTPYSRRWSGTCQDLTKTWTTVRSQLATTGCTGHAGV